ncbi:MAG: thiamine phosphate synthase [Nitrospirota bacterium]
MHLSGICFITDKKYNKLSLYETAFNVLKAGVRIIQYREKEQTRRCIYENALKLRRLTRHFNALLIINDHADIALALDADGVHLGQEDLPLKEARKIMGEKIVGISTHNLEQAEKAEEGGADYIGFGPVFHTTTKDAGEPVGIDNLRIIKQNVDIPVMAIGGINPDNIESVINAGADAAAVATAILKGDIAENTARLVEFFRYKKRFNN